MKKGPPPRDNFLGLMWKIKKKKICRILPYFFQISWAEFCQFAKNLPHKTYSSGFRAKICAFKKMAPKLTHLQKRKQEGTLSRIWRMGDQCDVYGLLAHYGLE